MQKLEIMLKILKTILRIVCIILIGATLSLLISFYGLFLYEKWYLIHKLNPTLLLFIEAWVLWIFGWIIVTSIHGINSGNVDLNKYLNFGIATKEEVVEKLGDITGKAVLEERGLVFWKFAFLWAIFGSLITIVLDHYLHIISLIEYLLKLYFGVT